MWTCATCGDSHDGMATVFGSRAPYSWEQATDGERAVGELNADVCALTLGEATHFFVRGHLEIPITDRGGETFIWSVWCSQSRESMTLAAQHWEDPDRVALRPTFGWLDTALPYDPTTLGLPTHVHTSPPGMVPRIVVDPSADHPLVRDQQNGLTWHGVAELNRRLLKGE